MWSIMGFSELSRRVYGNTNMLIIKIKQGGGGGLNKQLNNAAITAYFILFLGMMTLEEQNSSNTVCYLGDSCAHAGASKVDKSALARQCPIH